MTARRKARVSGATIAGALALALTAPAAAAPAPPALLPAPAAGIAADRVLILRPDRTTWSSVSVSPDGRTLVFDVLGDLYTMPATGGAARQISAGLPFDSQPTFSRDGKWIAFTSDRDGAENVWIARPDGSEARAITSFDDETVMVSPTWSADGTAVFASRYRADVNNVELWRFPLTGKPDLLAPIKPAPDAPRSAWRSTLDASASADGRWLYYARRVDGLEFDAPTRWTIYRRDLTTGAETEVITGSGGRGTKEETFFAPHVSPDGRKLAYVTRRAGISELRLRDLATGADTSLGETEPDALQASLWQGLVPGMAFTPKGDALILSHDGRFERRPIDGGKATVLERRIEARVAVMATNRRSIPEDTGPVVAKLAMAPVASPDGRRLAFAALGGIWVQEVGAATATRLPLDLELPMQPAWSPDRRTLAVVTWSERDGGAVWTLPASGGTPRRVSALPAYYRDPVFTPDGKALLVLRSSLEERRQTNFEYGPLRRSELVRLDLASGAARVIARGDFGGRPHFTNEPDAAYLLTGEGLGRVDLGTGAVATIARVTGPAYYFTEGPADADDLRISPDGRQIAAAIADRLYVLPRPTDPAAAIDVLAAGTPARAMPGLGADWFEWSGAGRLDVTTGTLFSRLDTAAATETAAMRFAATAPRAVPEGSILLHGATVLTMAGGDRVIENADLLVTGQRIAAIGPTGSIAVPRGTPVLEMAGKVIVPGFVDVHDHTGAIRRNNFSSEMWDLRARLAYGVTTSFDPSTLSIDHIAYEGLVDAGLVLGPRLRSTGTAVFSKVKIASMDDARRVAARYADAYGRTNLKEYRTGDRAVREWLSAAAREKGLLATTEGALSLKLDLTQILDGYAGNEHALPAVPGDDVIALMVAMRTSYDTTLSITNSGSPATEWFIGREDPAADAKLRRFWSPSAIRQKMLSGIDWHPLETQRFPQVAAGAARLAEAGGLVGMGSHGEVPGLGFHWEMEAHALGGMTPMAILHAATAGGAETIGRLDDLGTIEPGKLADLVILDADPLENIRNTRRISSVMRGGFLYDGETLAPLWPQAGPAPKAWFDGMTAEQWLPITDPPNPQDHH